MNLVDLPTRHVMRRYLRAVYPGVIIACRAIGLVRLSQKAKKKSGRERNDRVIAVPTREQRFGDGDGLSMRTKEELEQFFVNVVLMSGKEARIEGWGDGDEAEVVIRMAQQAYAAR